MLEAKPRPQLSRIMRRIQGSSLLAVVLAIGATLGFLAQSTESIDKILVAVKLKPDSLSLTRESQRDELSRQLAHSAYRRLFWMRTYLARVARGASKEEQDAAWSKHIESSENWASNTLVFLEAVDHFYGARKASCFEFQIQPRFNSVGSALADFRYAIPPESEARTPAIQRLNAIIDDLNVELYLFVRGFRAASDQSATTTCG